MLGRTVWAFADSTSVDVEDKLEIDRPLSFTGRISSVGYLQHEVADVDSIVVGVEGLTIADQVEEHEVAIVGAEDLLQLHRLHVPVLAIQQWEITRTLSDDLEIMQ